MVTTIGRIKYRSSRRSAAARVEGYRTVRNASTRPMASVGTNGLLNGYLGTFIWFNLFLSIIILMPFYSLATQVNMTISTMNETPLKEVGAGQPFLLEVHVADFQGGIAREPEIKGIDAFAVQQSGYQMRMINGQSEVLYKYCVRIDQPGTYTLGPAYFMEGQNRIESKPLTFEVGQEQTQDGQKNKKDDTCFLRLVCNKKSAVVGEKVACSVRFYTKNAAQLQQVIEPPANECTHFEIKNKTGPFQGTEVIEGISYNYAEWKWDLYPRTAGACLIPAYAADYLISDRRANFFGFFTMGTQKRTYSKAVTLKVNPLPHSAQSIDGVGIFTQLNSSINQTTAKVGEGLVYTLALTGDGDLDAIQLTLKNVPASCIWYDSKSYTQPSKSNDHFATKYFEYIIQPVQEGQIEIPAQKFSYFDPQTYSYKTLQSAPILIHATGKLPATSAPNTVMDSATTSADFNGAVKDDILPLYTTRQWKFLPERGMPLFLFLFLVASAVGIWILFLFKNSLTNMVQRLLVGKKDMFKQASDALQDAQKVHNYAALYPIFITLLSHILHCAPNEVTQEMMVKLFITKGATATTIEDWNSFFAHISEFVFYAKNKQSHTGDQLFIKAFVWLRKLQELVWK